MKTKLILFMMGIGLGMFAMYRLRSEEEAVVDAPKAFKKAAQTSTHSRTYQAIQKELQQAYPIDAYPYGLDRGSRAVHFNGGRITPPYFN